MLSSCVDFIAYISIEDNSFYLFVIDKIYESIIDPLTSCVVLSKISPICNMQNFQLSLVMWISYRNICLIEIDKVILFISDTIAERCSPLNFMCYWTYMDMGNIVDVGSTTILMIFMFECEISLLHEVAVFDNFRVDFEL